jgi:hypothetical protein
VRQLYRWVSEVIRLLKAGGGFLVSAAAFITALAELIHQFHQFLQ